MSHRRVFLPLLVALALPACSDAHPTALDPPADEAALELLAEAALTANDQVGVPLPSLNHLLHRTIQAVRAQEGPTEGKKLLRQARALLRQAAEAREAGDLEGARALEARSRARTLDAVILVLGTEVVGEAMAGVDQALARLGERLAGAALPERFEKGMDRAHALAQRAHAAWNEGNPRGALNAALASADLIRELVPRYQAMKAIQRATRAFKAGRDAVSGEPTEAEAEALGKARRLLEAAQDAYKARGFRKAVRLAKASADLSLDVLLGRSGG